FVRTNVNPAKTLWPKAGLARGTRARDFGGQALLRQFRFDTSRPLGRLNMNLPRRRRMGLPAMFRAALILVLLPATMFAEPPRGGAFKPVSKPSVPQAPKADVRTPIDAFLLAELQKHRLSFAPEADRTTFIRRVTFDLIGLPPTPAEIDAF